MSENRIDTQRPDAPFFSAYGTYSVGVKTLTLIHKHQIDLRHINGSKANTNTNTNDCPRYDRPLVTEVWYPALANSHGEKGFKRCYKRW